MTPGIEIETGIVNALRAMYLEYARGNVDAAREHFNRARSLHSQRPKERVEAMERERGLR